MFMCDKSVIVLLSEALQDLVLRTSFWQNFSLQVCSNMCVIDQNFVSMLCRKALKYTALLMSS